MTEPFLTITDLHAGYGEARVLQGLSFSVDRGEICAILGPNGAGKTTLLRAVSGMVRTTGTVRLDGADIAGRKPETIARRGVAHVPEGRGTFAPLTVEENLRLGAYPRRDRLGVEADLARIFTFFPVLKDKRRDAAGGLSGGQQQMLAIGRALMLSPQLLLLDEPSLGLSPLVTQELFHIIATINEQERITVLVVEQNAHLALGISSHAHVLETGRIVLSGTAAEVRKDEKVVQSYLGYRV